MLEPGTRVRFNWERESDGAYYRGEGNVLEMDLGLTRVRVDQSTLEIHDPLNTREGIGAPVDPWFFEEELEIVEGK